MTPSNPTSPALPVLSPLSPRSPMVLDTPRSSPLPQLVTTFSGEHLFQRQSMLSDMLTTPRSAGKTVYPWSRSNGSSCRRNSQASPAASPAQAAFSPMSPGFSTFSIRAPERAFLQGAQDGRQSRMAMRSPGYEMTLPLRVNTSLPNVQEEDRASTTSDSSTSSLIDWPGAVPSTTLFAPSHTASSRRLVRSHTPAPITTRSPIHKRAKHSHLPSLPPPPTYHVTVVPTISPRTQRARHQYANSVDHLRAPLVPLISVSTGLSHPQFPTSLLQYHLLTHEQLDSLARWYHQVQPPCEETFQYPALIPAWTSLHTARRSSTTSTQAATYLETKRRRWGRFIGLRGCDSPTANLDEDGNPVQGGVSRENAEELASRMEREWRRALERAEEESRQWEKSWRGRW